MSGSADLQEVAKFDALAQDWWKPTGPMAPLHAMNPARMGWIAERLGPLEGLRILDVGCGAGLASEWLARRGAIVTGLDAAGAALEAARAHAASHGVSVDYREGTPEDFAAEAFDAVISLEVIEHVPPAERAGFCAALARLTRPGGQVFLSTLNRTRRSYLFAILGAEQILRWLPRGTHDWKQFVTPEELGRLLRGAGLAVTDVAGMVPSLRTGFRIARDTGVNYLMAARKV
ncbi:bifunctional 2-polyprenyl-6-hydroxyphenol methylase/3-demethylubiquinol 3-O-methyltransferase UbiG [Roseococcus sp. SDR]|uniref:bifunctional 2-polyprenyl-6-hydroxyphenol methylase/3-demethylubiquinol 3-O-methyltransferase UbiG n=1 Tax=Roseococcus sp. SDR TaxID=2835532 RepID=UPI001BD110FB|nr:bifunctional 2-polyprenyl-6-hydroxyphenol methylase/3-demethylubiquinol 3-O-methyltransferase UbiG [Roseococcus sp. SDR]MBS7790440.1 bifunctional 2-polyprenyl-6-hydroxyphenol methylase/3-demethylubiquinol 3-O-methyltransferase UbiG [Roseococcus sp. SDR]MBV1845754.1 bifunctional 2-polyprenyl-6-hydroxyphenol methylase/3-demethylubiquinol 3-O-methyltransferase UbiG [Roseococcus sp. SDR]